MMSNNFIGARRPQNNQGQNCLSQCPACEFEPCPMCKSVTSEIDKEQSRVAGLYLRYMAGSLAGGAVLGAVIVTVLVGHLPLLIGLVSALFLLTAGIIWLFGNEYLRLGESTSGNRDLRVISVQNGNPACTCGDGV